MEVLPYSPLALVLTQIRFPAELTRLNQKNNEQLDSIMDSLGYPMSKPQLDATVQNDPGEGTVQLVFNGSMRVYANLDDSVNVAISGSFISLYCIRKNGRIPYAGHEQFSRKLGELADAVSDMVGTIPVSRIGYRYVDQMTLEEAEKVVSDMCKGFGIHRDESGKAFIRSSVLDGVFDYATDEGVSSSSGFIKEGLHVRSGILPGGSVVDPAVPARNESSWIIDLDSFSQDSGELNGESVRGKADALSRRAHEFFYRSAVNSNFVNEYGTQS